MKSYGMTDTGMCRSENQDTFSVTAFKSPRGGELLLAVVCDGMGGVKGGAVASSLCAETFSAYLAAHATPTRTVTQRAALTAANRAVYKRAREDDGALNSMGTTLVSALASERSVTLLSVGDSRAYLYRDGMLLPLTHDHSYVQQMMDAGMMTAEEASRSPYRNIITRAVGVSASVKGDVIRLAWREGDRILLCTDGLTGCVKADEICSILAQDETLFDMAHELVGAANSRGGEDNITALLLENTKENTFDA